MPTKPPSHNAHQVAQRKKDYDKQRDQSPWRKWYRSARWYSIRDYHKAKHPWCVECQKGGQLVEWTQLDHIVPHRGDYELFWAASNRQGLCDLHHGQKTRRGE